MRFQQKTDNYKNNPLEITDVKENSFQNKKQTQGLNSSLKTAKEYTGEIEDWSIETI